MKTSEAVEEYLSMVQRKRGQDSVTLLKYRSTLGVFLRIAGDRAIKSVTSKTIEDFFYGPGGIMDDHYVYRGGEKRLAGPVSAQTHNAYRKQLGTFFKWCRTRGYLRAYVMESIDNLTVPTRHRQRPSVPTLLALVEAADNPRDRALLALAVNTGLRASEITRIRVGDVDLDAGYVRVTVKKTGQVDEQPISLELDRELRAWMTFYAAELDVPLSGDLYLLPSRQGGVIDRYETAEDGSRYPVRTGFTWKPHNRIQNPAKIVQKYLAVVGLETYQEGIHTIRRAVARAYFDAAAESGYDGALRETAAMLHHASTRTTEIYLGIEAEVIKRDERIKGKAFLTALVDDSNVVPLVHRRSGEAAH